MAIRQPYSTAYDASIGTCVSKTGGIWYSRISTGR